MNERSLRIKKVTASQTRSTRDSGIFVGRDLHTGEVKVEFPPDVNTYWFHHRCYMSKATDKFLIPTSSKKLSAGSKSKL